MSIRNIFKIFFITLDQSQQTLIVSGLPRMIRDY